MVRDCCGSWRRQTTAKAHLESIFAETAVSRQADLRELVARVTHPAWHAGNANRLGFLRPPGRSVPFWHSFQWPNVSIVKGRHLDSEFDGKHNLSRPVLPARGRPRIIGASRPERLTNTPRREFSLCRGWRVRLGLALDFGVAAGRRVGRLLVVERPEKQEVTYEEDKQDPAACRSKPHKGPPFMTCVLLALLHDHAMSCGADGSPRLEARMYGLHSDGNWDKTVSERN